MKRIECAAVCAAYNSAVANWLDMDNQFSKSLHKLAPAKSY